MLLRRRWLAAVCVGLAVAAGLNAVTAPPAPTVSVLAAARDLPAGTVVAAEDLIGVRLPPHALPVGLVDDPTGRMLASPLRRGEQVTDARLVGQSLLSGYPGVTAVPVRLPDPGVLALLRVGDRIDLLATDPEGGGTRIVAHEAVVIAIPSTEVNATASGLPGALVVIGTTPAQAGQVADSAVRSYLSVQFDA
jgi:Flp pilus assembly protein CpaB